MQHRHGNFRNLDRIADALIAPSFGNIAMRWRKKTWDPTDLHTDLSGHIAVVTGANSGIGFATAQALGRLGAHVVLVCRNRERGEKALEELKTEGQFSLELCDLSSLKSVNELCNRLESKFQKIDYLVNNAGMYSKNRTVTSEGFETVFTTNVLSPFLLTKKLLPLLEKSKRGRVVYVSSAGMYLRSLNVEDPQFERRKYKSLECYADSKRALVVLNENFSQKFSGRGVSFYCMHPGWVHTSILSSGMPTFTSLFRPILRSPEQGADTIVWLVACPKIQEQTGLFWFDRRPRAIHTSQRTATSREDAIKFWELCESLTQPYV